MSTNKASQIRITPLYGGQSETGVCTLLELGGARILLDCGTSVPIDYKYLQEITQELMKAGGVDAIILSHADMHHVGALPLIAGKHGVQDITVFGTCPVGRFSKLLLYDFVLNMKMEGDSVSQSNYDFDDIDHAFMNFQELRYSQTFNLPYKRSSGIEDGSTKQAITICALPAGRTIGGAIWRIKCGPTEVLYTMDVNTRKEMVLTEATTDLLPSSPTLMITEAASASRGATQQKKKKDKEESQQLIKSIMETVRAGGNVLLPCETAGRVLELLQILSKHWTDEKIGQYHLVFLSHMAHNVIEYAQSQLEWMSETLTKDFYDGKANPFELKRVKVATSVNQLERNFPGPKVVLATDASLTYGLSKEVLLKWGGDPRCRVIFTDFLDKTISEKQKSLAAKLLDLSANPPIITAVEMPTRVELAGQELIDYKQEQERLRRLKEEELQRKRRQEELSQFQVVKQNDADEEDLDDEVEVGTDHIKKKFKSNARVSLLKQNFVTFERIEPTFTVDEYGMSIDDLTFKDIQNSESKWSKDKGDNKLKNAGQVGSEGVDGNASKPVVGNEAEDSSAEQHPWKIVPISQRMQFTCDFKQFNISGRLDSKSMKSLLSKVAPVKLFILRGTSDDCTALANMARACKIQDVYAPSNRQSASFQVLMEKLQLQIPSTHIPSNMKIMKNGTSGDCAVCLLQGSVTTTMGSSGTVMRYMDKIVKESNNGDTSADTTTDHEETDGEVYHPAPVISGLKIQDDTVGAISMGEVAFTTLKQHLESVGIETEIKLISAGTVLICGKQVVIRKEKNNFSIEGPPVPAFFEARKALYQQFVFI